MKDFTTYKKYVIYYNKYKDVIYLNINKIDTYLKENLSKKRYEHSLLVAKEAKSLAKIYHVDEEKAYLAGLIHDIAKELSEDENNYWIKKGNLADDLKKENYKKIRHADIGALIAKEKYNLDNDICNAIKYHTIGNKNMDTLAKIIYIADKIGRKEIPKELIPIKDLVKKDLNAALIYFIEKQNKNLISKNITPHKNTEELLQTLKKQNKNS